MSAIEFIVYMSIANKSLSEKWLPAVTFTIRNMQNRNGYFNIIDLL